MILVLGLIFKKKLFVGFLKILSFLMSHEHNENINILKAADVLRTKLEKLNCGFGQP